MYSEVAGMLYRRAIEGPPQESELPSWTIWVVIADFILFFPILLVLGYTFNRVIPTLAMIEDENPPAYDPVSLGDGDGAGAGADADPAHGVTDGKPKPVTSSLRAAARLLRSHGGYRAYLRGLACLVAQAAATWFLIGVFNPLLPSLLGGALATLLSALALVQLSAAWVHIIATPHSPKRFTQRLPPFRRTFDATARPVLLYWAASQVAAVVPTLVALGLGLDLTPDYRLHAKPAPGDAWKALVIWAVAVSLHVFLLIPAHVVLVRVQASLLPVDEDAIVPFDRSFQGTVEPQVVGGKGYVSASDAWKTFSRAAWRRLIVLYVKIFAVWLAAYALIAVVVAPEIILILKHSTAKEPQPN